MTGQSDWFRDQKGTNGIPYGPRAAGPIFLDALIFVDESDGTYWRLSVSGGELRLVQVTL
jgi:hypothetical protein